MEIKPWLTMNVRSILILEMWKNLCIFELKKYDNDGYCHCGFLHIISMKAGFFFIWFTENPVFRTRNST